MLSILPPYFPDFFFLREKKNWSKTGTGQLTENEEVSIELGAEIVERAREIGQVIFQYTHFANCVLLIFTVFSIQRNERIFSGKSFC